MTKAFFYETVDGTLHRCMFAGLDSEGEPQWLMIDQRDEVMTLKQYREMNVVENDQIRLLCLEGERMEPLTVACLLGAVLQGYLPNVKEALENAYKVLGEMGIGWHQGALNVKVVLRKYYEEVCGKDCYRYYIVGDGCVYLVEQDDFKTMKQLMDTLCCYFDALEQDYGIRLHKTITSDNVDLSELDVEDKLMFDKIISSEL